MSKYVVFALTLIAVCAWAKDDQSSSNTAGIIATDTASPFQVSTTMAVTGSWTLSATATNSQGSETNSGSTTINIGPN